LYNIINQMIFEDHLKAIEAEIPKLVRELTVEARLFFDQSWDNKDFTDAALVAWDPVLNRDGTTKDRPLVQSGALRRSLRTEVNNNVGVVYTEILYAQIHNEGGPVKYTANVRAHTRKGKPVKAHTRTVDYTMPKRQYMGSSQVLEDKMTEIITERLKGILGMD
jgi:phage gpG-like protein